jgi:hypothetical protein
MAIQVGASYMESLLLEDRETARQAIETWSGNNADCGEHYERALSAWRAGESALENVRVITEGTLWEFDFDPRESYLRAVAHINSLMECLRENVSPEPGGGGGGSEPASEDDPPPALPASSGGWRVAAGLGLIALAAYGFWRMK